MGVIRKIFHKLNPLKKRKTKTIVPAATIEKKILKKTLRILPKTPESHQRLLNYLKENLYEKRNLSFDKDKFFESLKQIGYAYSVRKFKFEGKKYAVKYTAGDSEHGYDYGKIRRAVSVYQKKIKEGILRNEYHELKSIKIIGKIGPYLIMPFIEDEKVNLDEIKAVKEVKNNFHFLLSNHLIDRMPQVRAFIYKKNKKDKKPVVYVAYDYF